jgi:hypothetical protein
MKKESFPFSLSYHCVGLERKPTLPYFQNTIYWSLLADPSFRATLVIGYPPFRVALYALIFDFTFTFFVFFIQRGTAGVQQPYEQ